MMEQQLCTHDSKCCLGNVLLEADTTLVSCQEEQAMPSRV